jgi:heptosyltransferase-1
VEEAFAPLLEGHPDLHRVVPVRLRAWRRAVTDRRTRRELAALRSSFADLAPDVALDLMGNHKGALLARLSGARRVVGLARAHRREPSSGLWIREAVDLPAPGGDGGQPVLHAVDRALALVTALGVPPEPADFGGDRLLPGLPRPPLRHLVIHPGAGWANKRYPPARWGAVARRLADATRLPVRVPVASGEEELAAALVDAAEGAAEAVPAPDLATLAGELLGAHLVLGGDTGPLHLAHALGRPVVAVMGPTDPRRHGPYGDPGAAVWQALPCSFCYKRFRETKACLLAVPVPAVVDRALAVLSRVRHTRTAGNEPSTG